MQMLRPLDKHSATPAGWGVHLMLISRAGAGPDIAQRLGRLGAVVAPQSCLETGLVHLVQNPRAAQILVVDCDAYGGAGAVWRAFKRHKLCLPLILITADCAEQRITQALAAPVMLRAPVSMLALGVAFDAIILDRRVIGAV